MVLRRQWKKLFPTFHEYSVGLILKIFLLPVKDFCERIVGLENRIEKSIDCVTRSGQFENMPFKVRKS